MEEKKQTTAEDIVTGRKKSPFKLKLEAIVDTIIGIALILCVELVIPLSIIINSTDKISFSTAREIARTIDYSSGLTSIMVYMQYIAEVFGVVLIMIAILKWFKSKE